VRDACELLVRKMARFMMHTLLQILLSSVDLGDLLVQELVTLLADGHDLLASNAELGDLIQNLLGDLGGTLVLCEGVGVVQGVI
jgi:hypothetical protein